MKKFCSLLLLGLLSLSTITAAETAVIPSPRLQQAQNNECFQHDRIPLGKAPSGKQLKNIQKARKALAKQHKHQAHRLHLSSKAYEKCCGLFNSSSIQPIYRIKGIGATGRTLTFDNETIWEISDSNSKTAKNWAIGSYVVIVPNKSWFSSYTYSLENLSDGRSSVTANLSEGPFKKYATFITGIDRLSNMISLTDGSLWTINSDSSSLTSFRDWKIGQAVLLGESRGWFGWPNGNIVININENNYIPARTYR